jgi:hypothetical protein
MIPIVDTEKKAGFLYLFVCVLVVVILLSCATAKAKDIYNPYENKIR